jgi:drug/metabolite transporter (DMT)-like permease
MLTERNREISATIHSSEARCDIQCIRVFDRSAAHHTSRRGPNLKHPISLALILGGGILAMSSAAVFIRLAQGMGAPSLVIAAYRLSIATLLMSALAVPKRAWADYAKLNLRQVALFVVSGLLLGLHFASWITSLGHTSVVSSVVLVSTTPLWIGLLSPLLLQETTPRLTWLGMLLAVAGGIVIALADSSSAGQTTMWGNFLALVGAWMMAGYLMIGRSVRARLPLVSYLWLVYGSAAVLLVVWSAVSGLQLTGYSWQVLLLMLALGAIPQLIGHTAANYAVRHMSASFVAVSILGEPVGSTVLAMLLLDERPVVLQIAGGGLILGGIVLASLAEERRRTRIRASAGSISQ